MRWLSLGPAGSWHPFGVSHGRTLSTPLQDGLRFLQPPLPPQPSPVLAVGIPPMVGLVGLPQWTSEKMRMKEDGTCSPVGIWGTLRESCGLSELPTAVLALPVSPFGSLPLYEPSSSPSQMFLLIHPPLALGRVRLPAFGTLSPALRTLDYSAARLGRGTWMPQGPVARHFPACPCKL
jgi:hypothetical protein